MNKIKAPCWILVICLVISGCGYPFLPGPTAKTVTKSDLIGVWEYPADYQKTTVTIEFKEDNTFVQTITRPSPAPVQTHTGSWTIEGNAPQLTLLKPEWGAPANPWILEEADWWMMDSVLNKRIEVSICGAADDRDPDSCFEMKKIRSQ